MVSERLNMKDEVLSPRLLFKFVLKIFYGTIVVEGTENIPLRGQPWLVCCTAVPRSLIYPIHSIVCANHSNSLTDAL